MRLAASLVLCLALNAVAFPVPKKAKAQTVAGTRWSGPIQWTNYQLLTQTIKFEEGGKVTMSYAQIPGTTYTGSWKQDGEKLSFDFSGGSWYEATLDGEEWRGTARNNSSMTATHSAKREAAP